VIRQSGNWESGNWGLGDQVIKQSGDWVIREMAGEEMKDIDERLARWQGVFESWLVER
jgi:hypothetical protein